MTLFGPDSHDGSQLNEEITKKEITPKDAQEAQEDCEPEVALVRIAMVVSYDGQQYHGFAAQPGQVTVSGALSVALSKVTGSEVGISCAGRTDAGVHALGQVIHFDVADKVADAAKLLGAVNRQLAPSIVALSAKRMPGDFHSRHSAVARIYKYRIWNSPLPDPFQARTSWWVEQPLDMRALRLAVYPLLGEHDFSAFCRQPPGKSGPINRRLTRAIWQKKEAQLLELELESNAFCHQMVRSIVGTLVRAGRGKINAAKVGEILAGTDRAAASELAPAYGLFLAAVRYGDASL